MQKVTTISALQNIPIFSSMPFYPSPYARVFSVVCKYRIILMQMVGWYLDKV